MVMVQKWLESVCVLKFERGTDPPPPLIEQLKIVGISYELNLPCERVGVTSDLNPIILSRIIRTRVHLVGWIDKWNQQKEIPTQIA